MSNSIATPTVFARAGLKLLKNNLVMARVVDTSYTPEFRKVGDTVKAKRHPEYTAVDGRVATNQDVLEGQMDVKLDTQAHVKVKFNSYEETLSVESLLHSKNMDAAMCALAQRVDSALMGLYKHIPNFVGSAGNVISTPTAFFAQPQRLDDGAVPSANRSGVLHQADWFALAGYFTGTTQAGGYEIGQEAITRAQIPMIGDVQPYKTQSVKKHTSGTWSSTALIKGADQNVNYADSMNGYKQNLLIDGLADAETIKVGDVFTISAATAINAVNPRTKEDLGYKRQFAVLPGTHGSNGYSSVTETYTFSTTGSSEITIVISPPIITQFVGGGSTVASKTNEAYQTVTASPANNAVIQPVAMSNTTQNMSFHENAFVLCVADLAKPYTGEWDIASDPDTGLSVRYWRYSDGDNDEHAHRYDILFGATCLDNRLATRGNG